MRDRDLRLESGIDDVLLDDLRDVDDDDTVRVTLLLDALIAHVEEYPRGDYDDVPAADALWILRNLRAQEPTAGELRAKLASFRAQLARGEA